MIIIYLIPSGFYLVTFLLMLGVCSAIAETMSAIYIIFMLLVMLCPIAATLFGLYCCCDEDDNMITKHTGAAITMMTITSVVSTVVLFMALKSEDMSRYEGLGGLLYVVNDGFNMLVIFLIIAVCCGVEEAMALMIAHTPMKVAFNHILLTAGCFTVLWFWLTT